MKNSFLCLALGIPLLSHTAAAAIGCTLNNPARDLKSLYPDMTTYREQVVEWHSLHQGRDAYEVLRARMGGGLDPVYEGFDTPYTLYEVFRGQDRIGWVHGVNVAGRGGVIQVFVSMDPATAGVRRMFFQRLESPGSRALRARENMDRFTGLTLADFYKHDYFSVAEPGHPSDRVGALVPPRDLPDPARPDWTATLRGLRKNLILLDLFVFDRRHDPFYDRAHESLKQKAMTHVPHPPLSQEERENPGNPSPLGGRWPEGPDEGGEELK